MNAQLVNSLVEVVLNLSPEDQTLFQSQLSARQASVEPHKTLTPTEKVHQFREWVARFPKSNVSLSAKALDREHIYGDRGA
jgi:hypothetical protein